MGEVLVNVSESLEPSLKCCFYRCLGFHGDSAQLKSMIQEICKRWGFAYE